MIMDQSTFYKMMIFFFDFVFVAIAVVALFISLNECCQYLRRTPPLKKKNVSKNHTCHIDCVGFVAVAG